MKPSIRYAIAATCAIAGFTVGGVQLAAAPVSIPASLFRSASWTCNDGSSAKLVGAKDDKNCRGPGQLESIAASHCRDHCTNGACGVKSFKLEDKCKAPKTKCGNNICESGEANTGTFPVCPVGEPCPQGGPVVPGTCPRDCAAPAPVCGNNICESGEANTGAFPVCPVGEPCPQGGPVVPGTCPRDCAAPAPVCGNNVCEEGEADTVERPVCLPYKNCPMGIIITPGTCPSDCPASGTGVEVGR